MILSLNFKLIFSESSNFFRIGFLSVLFVLSQSLTVIGQGIKFELVTGTQKHDDAKCIIQTLDSGYAVVGSTSGFGSGQSDIYLTKISKAGFVTWQQAIGGAGVDKGNSLIQTADSGFAIAGYSNSAGTGGYDVYLAKTDKNGMLEWSNTYGGFDWDFGNSIIQSPTGEYVICGNTYSYGNGNGDVYLLKADSIGTLLWDSAYGGSLEDAGNSVCLTADSGYFITGYTKSFGQGMEDVYLLKADSMGNQKWAKTYGGIKEDIGNDGKLTSDGGFIVIGSAKSLSPAGFYENWMLKTDAGGDILWFRNDPTTADRFATSICLTADGGYAFTGHDNIFGDYSMFLYKTDGGGYYQDYKRYGGAQTENAFSVRQTYDKGYVMAGITESYGTGKPNIYVLKTDSNRISTGTILLVIGVEENQMARSSVSVYPNPASDHFLINAERKSALEIFDAMGKNVSSRPINRGNNRIDISGLPEGIYFISIRNEVQIASGKIIVRH